MKTINGRSSNYEINDIFLKRHSPRAMSGESLSLQELMTLFEAARWAPSAYNIQPWNFVYAMRDTKEFENIFSFLVDFNKAWCVNAGALIVTISRNNGDTGKPSITHSFDTGAAWENLALQAQAMGLIAHGMNGFDYALAKEKLGVPDDHSIEMMIAVGKPGKIEPEAMRAGETPNDRKPLKGMVFEGKFSA